jgi:[ribosomal protein S5]-alanine N-acetyltransferase
VIGLCGFNGPPDCDGVVEIAYSIAPGYQHRGYATEVARSLVDFASQDRRVRIIRAHTLAQSNASTRVLEKCGFKRTGETVEPESNVAVWRWEKPARPTSTF